MDVGAGAALVAAAADEPALVVLIAADEAALVAGAEDADTALEAVVLAAVGAAEPPQAASNANDPSEPKTKPRN